MTAVRSGIRVRVHDRGDRRPGGILRLIEEAGRPRPLPEVLDALVREIAAIARVDVVSVYVRERDGDDGDGRGGGVGEGERGGEGDALVMRANVGFAAGAVGNVRLRPGEGITGLVAECLRPVSCAVARDQAAYKHVPGLGEEHFPSFLGVPLLVGGQAGGVLVLQRRQARDFSPAEVALATALAAPVAFALERARARAAEREAEAALPTRAARLAGAVVAPGGVLGRAEPLAPCDPRGLPRPGDAVAAAFASIARELERARRRLEPALDAEAARRLRVLALLLDDRRLRELAVAECARAGVAPGLRRVAREYARASYRVGGVDGEPWLDDRPAEVEDLCLLVGARAAGERILAAGAVVVTERLSALVALAAWSRRAAGFALAGRVEPDALAAAVARAAGLPVVAEVAGLFAWVRPGDRVLVDGDAGLVRVNPPATAIARLRAVNRGRSPVRFPRSGMR